MFSIVYLLSSSEHTLTDMRCPTFMSASLIRCAKAQETHPISIIKATGLHQSFDSLCLEPSGAGMCQNDVVPAALKYWFGALFFGFIVFLCKCLCYMCQRCVCACVHGFVCIKLFVCVCVCVTVCVCAAAKLPTGTSVS